MRRWLYRLLRAWAEADLGFAQYRRDLIDREIWQGENYDIADLQQRRQRITAEINAYLADIDRWSSALHDLALNAGAGH